MSYMQETTLVSVFAKAEANGVYISNRAALIEAIDHLESHGLPTDELEKLLVTA